LLPGPGHSTQAGQLSIVGTAFFWHCSIDTMKYVKKKDCLQNWQAPIENFIVLRDWAVNICGRASNQSDEWQRPCTITRKMVFSFLVKRPSELKGFYAEI